MRGERATRHHVVETAGPLGPGGQLERDARRGLVALYLWSMIIVAMLYFGSARIRTVHDALVIALAIMLVIPLMLSEYADLGDLYWRFVVSITILAAVGKKNLDKGKRKIAQATSNPLPRTRETVSEIPDTVNPSKETR